MIAGHLRSRVLVAPAGNVTRPTSDRLRETLFNVWGPQVIGAHFADLYAGSGAVGIEALSRGAASCLFVERAPAALASIRQNLTALQLIDTATVDSRPVLKALGNTARQQGRFDLVFLDPPYESAEDYTSTLHLLGTHHARLLAPGALVVAEHARRSSLPEGFGALRHRRLLEQGDAALSFYSVEPAPET